MNQTLFYFAYGSNMSTPRFSARVPSARVVTTAHLSGHRLQFHKKGKDGSGKCNVEFTNIAKDVVHGVIWEIAASQKMALDKAEGLHHGYAQKRISIHTPEGGELHAVTYHATAIDPKLRPFGWYLEHVVRGACEHGLPREYIHSIANIEVIADPDLSRHAHELSLYSSCLHSYSAINT